MLCGGVFNAGEKGKGRIAAPASGFPRLV